MLRQVESVNLELSPLQTALEDFYLRRRAMRWTPSTLTYYWYSAGTFVTWLQLRNFTDPKEVAAARVRKGIGPQADRLKDMSLHARARGGRTFVRFLHDKGYMHGARQVRHAPPREAAPALSGALGGPPDSGRLRCPEEGDRLAVR
ncbi:MAG: hypothetical protein ABSG98_05910 [Anaerolineales bacterium]|jgi:hypothetical protein